METPDRNLGLDLVRVTEATALASARWLGRGDKIGGDGAATNAMRLSFNIVPMKGTIVIGEGEKDEAPMLFIGEKVGTGEGPETDIAVDPIDGTTLLANGMPNAIAVAGAAPGGSMYIPGHSYYMQKLVVPEGTEGLEIDSPMEDILKAVGKAKDKKIEDLVVFLLDRPRNQHWIDEIRRLGARIQLHQHGDIMGALMAVSPASEVDIMIGIGGSPEGVISACAVKGFGGQMLARLNPLSEKEKNWLLDNGADLKEVMTQDDLVRSDDTTFVATGISGGLFLDGVKYTDRDTAETTSLVVRSKTRTVRYIKAQHDLKQLAKFSSISY